MGGLAPTQYSDIETRCKKNVSEADSGAVLAIQEQSSWLVGKIRELWLEEDAEPMTTRSVSKSQSAEKEEKQEVGVGMDNSFIVRILDDMTMLLDDSPRPSGNVSIHALSTLAWKRDKVMQILKMLGAKVTASELANNKTQDILERLLVGDGKKDRTLSPEFRLSARLSREEEEDKARINYFSAKVGFSLDMVYIPTCSKSYSNNTTYCRLLQPRMRPQPAKKPHGGKRRKRRSSGGRKLQRLKLQKRLHVRLPNTG